MRMSDSPMQRDCRCRLVLAVVGRPSSARARRRRQPAADRAPAVGGRGGQPGARAEPRHPDRAAEPADSGPRHRAGAQLWVPTLHVQPDRTTRPNSPSDQPVLRRPEQDHRLAVRDRSSASARCCRPAATTRSTWNSSRATSTQLLHTPSIRCCARAVAFNVTQPLLRNFKIDNTRQQLEISRKDPRERPTCSCSRRSSRRRAT